MYVCPYQVQKCGKARNSTLFIQNINNETIQIMKLQTGLAVCPKIHLHFQTHSVTHV